MADIVSFNKTGWRAINASYFSETPSPHPAVATSVPFLLGLVESYEKLFYIYCDGVATSLASSQKNYLVAHSGGVLHMDFVTTFSTSKS